MHGLRQIVIAVIGGLILLSVSVAQQVPAGSQGQRPASRPGYDRSGRKIVLAWADNRNTGTMGLQHDSVSHALATIERLGYESGTYDTFIRTDSNVISKNPVDTRGKAVTRGSLNLDQVDAIFFFGLREIELSDQQKTELMSAIKDRGMGFVATHTAGTAFMDWPEFGEMLGGWLDLHWAYRELGVAVEDPGFPGAKHLRPAFKVNEEPYLIKGFSREKSRAILRWDPSTLPAEAKLPADADCPIAWAKMYGKGRVFYGAIGHDVQAWDNPDVYRIYFEALKWALGLTNADIAPRPFPAAAVPGPAK
jgi:uncharacterized protein